MNEATLEKEQLDLLALSIPHFGAIGVEECKHYLRTENRGGISDAFRRGFVLPSAIIPSVAPFEAVGYPIGETDCLQWLGHMEKFAEKYFGVKVSIRDMFPIPEKLPWNKILPVFNPGLTHREMMNKAFNSRTQPYEYTDVMQYNGSCAMGTVLYLTERSLRPNEATMGMPPKFAKQLFTFAGHGTVPVNLCAYGIGTCLHHEVEKQYLDPETWTWFPENKLSGGYVAYGRYDPSNGEVGFDCSDSGCERGRFGFREAICLKPKT